MSSSIKVIELAAKAMSKPPAVIPRSDNRSIELRFAAPEGMNRAFVFRKVRNL